MFESIVVRRTNPAGSPGSIDIGRLAEAMIFYQRVHLAFTRPTLRQMLDIVGPDLTIELVENESVDAVLLDRDVTVRNQHVGTAAERHRPATIALMTADGQRPKDRYEIVYDVFNEALDGQPRKARRKANRLLNSLREHKVPADMPTLALGEWQNHDFMLEAVRLALASLVPGYTPPDDLRVDIEAISDGNYRFNSNIDWAPLRAAQTAHTGIPSTLGPADVLLMVVEMVADLHLGATLNATLSQDRLGAQLLRAKCVDLRASADIQELQIDQFQDLVVHGVTDIPDVINSGARSLDEFLKVRSGAKPFRKWLDGQQPDADLVKAYHAEIDRRLELREGPLGKLRWMLPVGTDGTTAIVQPHLDPYLAAAMAGYGLFDRFVMERYVFGWRPASFIDRKLRPFVGRELNM